MLSWQRKWDRTSQLVPALATLADLFTPEELARLFALRARSRALRASEEFGLDACRIAFARWLVEHGRLSEER